MPHNLTPTRAIILVVVAVCAITTAAQACPVCFGDPDSEMVQGAQAGVIFMLGVVYAVLLGFGGFMALWIVRARKIRLNSPNQPD